MRHLSTLALLILSGIGVGLSGQSTGSTTADLEGSLRGHDRSALAGALVHLQLEATGRTFTARTDGAGAFHLRFLPPGVYRMKASAPGHQVLQVQDLVLQVGTRHRIALDLLPEVETQVLGAAPGGLDTLRTQASAVVNSRHLEALPIDRRTFLDLALATPWALPGRGPVNEAAPHSGLSFSGAGPRQNSFLVDGCDHNDLGNGAPAGPLAQAAIQEFQILGGGYGVEQGRALGGVVQALTRSGSNTFQGSAFWFERPGAWDARPATGPNTADLRRLQAGATFGGPLVKDRLFYFVAVERLVQQDQRVVAIDPLALAPIAAAGFHVENGALPVGEQSTSLLLKADWQPAAQHIFGLSYRRGWERNDDQLPFGGLRARSLGANRDTTTDALALTHRWLASDHWVNELRLQRSSRENSLRSLDPDRTVQVDILGTASFGTQRLTPQDTLAVYVQMADVLTGVFGDHTLKMGVDLLETRNQGLVKQNFGGYYLFAALPPLGIPSSLAAFSLPNPFGGTGLPAAFLQAFGDPHTRFTTGQQAVFLQEEWRVTSDVYLRAGLRWDRERLPRFPQTSDYQALATQPSGSDPVLGPIRLPDGQVPFSDLLRPDLDWGSSRLAPRVSVTWQVTPSLRFFGGAGIFTGTTALGPLFGIRTSDGEHGFGVLHTLLDGTTPIPWMTWANIGGLIDRRYTTPPTTHRVIVIPGTARAPHSRQASLGAEWQLAEGMQLTLDGLVAEGRDLMTLRDVNPYVAGPRRPDLRYASVFRADASGLSRSTSWTLGWSWRLPGGDWVQAGYTLRDSRDDVVDWSGAQSPQDTFHPHGDWGPSYQDQRHSLVASMGLRSPASAAPFLRDWTLSALLRVGSGRPYTLLAGQDRNEDGDASSDRPAGVGRNSERLPTTARLDLRLIRAFPLGRARLETSLDVFNALNRANVAEVQNSLASTTPPVRSPIAFDAMRQLQLGVKLAW